MNALIRAISRKGNPVEEALRDCGQLEARRNKLGERLADCVEKLELLQRERRELLMTEEVDPARLAKLDRECADAEQARAGVEEAGRHLAELIEDAGEKYRSLVDQAARVAAIADCEYRATEIDAAAARVSDAAKAFSDAMKAFTSTVQTNGLPRDWLGGPMPIDLIVKPIGEAAWRLAMGIVAEPRYMGDIPPTNDVLVAARRAQSGLLRDHADSVREGRIAPEQAPRIGHAKPQIKVIVPERSIVLRHGITFTSEAGLPRIMGAGSARVPEPLADALVEAGIAFHHGTREAIEVMRDIDLDRRAVERGLDRHTGRPKVQDLPSYPRFDFDLQQWIETERARRAGEAGE